MRKYYKETKKLRWDSILSQLMLLIFGEGFLQIIATSFLNAGVIGLFWNTGKYVDDLPEIMLSSFLTILTLVYIIGEWGKENYIIYSIDNIIERYRIREKLTFMLGLVGIQYISFFAAGVFQNVPNKYRLYIMAKVSMLAVFLYFLILVIYIAFLMIDIFLGNQTQRKMLKELYVDIRTDLLLRNESDIKKEFVLESLEYLVEEYEKEADKVDLVVLKNIEYKRNTTESKTKATILRRKSISQLIIFNIAFVSIIAMNVPIVPAHKIILWIVTLLLIEGIEEIAYKLIKPFRRKINEFVCGQAAYWYKKDNKDNIILFFQLGIRDKYARYMQNFENIVVFCRTMINAEKNITDIKNALLEKYKESEKKSITVVILCVEEMLKTKEGKTKKWFIINKSDGATESAKEAREWQNICQKYKNSEYAKIAQATYRKMNWEKIYRRGTDK